MQTKRPLRQIVSSTCDRMRPRQIKFDRDKASLDSLNLPVIFFIRPVSCFWRLSKSAGLLDLPPLFYYRAIDGCGPLSFETGEIAMKSANAKLTGLAVLAGAMLFGAANVEAGGYFYRAR